jgi:hypothetical protein
VKAFNTNFAGTLVARLVASSLRTITSPSSAMSASDPMQLSLCRRLSTICPCWM